MLDTSMVLIGLLFAGGLWAIVAIGRGRPARRSSSPGGPSAGKPGSGADEGAAAAPRAGLSFPTCAEPNCCAQTRAEPPAMPEAAERGAEPSSFDPADAPPTDEALPGPAESGHRALVLCIDDDPAISRVIGARLARYGVEVVQAFSGMEGYWLALKRRPDAIITDLHMPDGQGNYLLGRFRGHSLIEGVPIVMLTAEDNPAMKRHMLSLGVDAYLVKPLNFEELLGKLREYFPIPDKPVTKGGVALPVR